MNMPVEMAYEYSYAKSDQLRFRDLEQTRERGMGEFLDAKSYRPGLGPVKRTWYILLTLVRKFSFPSPDIKATSDDNTNSQNR